LVDDDLLKKQRMGRGEKRQQPPCRVRLIENRSSAISVKEILRCGGAEGNSCGGEMVRSKIRMKGKGLAW